MKTFRTLLFTSLCAGLLQAEPAASPESQGQITMFIGIDVSGSFYNTGNFDNALEFTARYIHAHLNGLGGLKKPKALFVGTIGGERRGEVKSFHPIHDFQDKSIAQMEKDLRTWFPRKGNPMTDFNAFFDMVATLVKRQGLVLAPLEVVMISDGIPEVSSASSVSVRELPYDKINMKPLEYLARRVTVRLLYASPTVGDLWEKKVPRSRIRFWPREAEVMTGWKRHIKADTPFAEQDKFFKWVSDNVDFRVKSRKMF